MSFEFTEFTKLGGPLTKQIWLEPDGSLRTDGSACIMIAGCATRFRFDRMDELAQKINKMGDCNALALGALAADVRNPADVTTSRRLNGIKRPDLIARTQEYLGFRPGAPAVALFDHDGKGMPPEVAERVADMGGFWSAITSVVPGLERVARVSRASTSAGLLNCNTGEPVLISNGNCHVYIAVKDGADIRRFLTTLHQRCWLAGLGWLMLGAAGQMLERSIVDVTVGSPERLVFEGPPRLELPLQQDPQIRQPVAAEGELLDTTAACPPLSPTEVTKFHQLLEQERLRLRPEAEGARRRYVSRTAQRLRVSERVIERRCEGVLRPENVLEFDDEELAGTTVADVLTASDKFIGETLADPVEGVDYGRCKAKVMRQGCNIVIHSFAHGLGTIYQLKWDKRAIEAAVRAAEPEDALQVLIDGIVQGDVDPVETEGLLAIGVELTKIGKRGINAALKKAREAEANTRACEERERKISALRDHRPQMATPRADAEWQPVVDAITEVLANSSDPEPPMRDPDGHFVVAWVRRVPRLHALTGAGEEAQPAPEQLLITRLTEPLLAELIERHVAFVADDRSGVRLVHLDSQFVHHLAHRPGDRLPILTAVSTLPVVLDDGEIMRTNGLHRACGTIFGIPEKVLAMLPPRECGDDAVRSAITFLRDEWLCDVTTGSEGKYILIALALTIIERVLLPERPAFFIISGVRGGGKTTVLNMISFAILGQRASAAAWSWKDEERRKALFAYLLEGVPFLVWDNLERGVSISCPHIERALTAETFSDRVLGVSGTSAPFASMVQAFTGNNVAPRGDLVSRSLRVLLVVSRLDPENRRFKHPDPFAWTLEHRCRIMGALYTILLGNPRRHIDPPDRDPEPTRFKPWWNLVGSAVEHAARVDDDELSFKDLFARWEQEDVQTSGIVAAVALLHEAWPCTPFQASDAVQMAQRGARSKNEVFDLARARAFRAALAQVDPKPLNRDVTSTIMSWRLKAMCDVPAEIGTDTIMLRSRSDRGKHGTWFETEKTG